MEFVHFSLLAGAAAATIPIVLHLLLRQQPRKMEFPALVFLKRRELTTKRSLNLRHLLLLAARIAAICLLAFALARPKIKTTRAFAGHEAPAAVAMVFDTAPRMEYRASNQTRLEAAREIADALIADLPPDSELAVLDARGGEAAFQIDLSAAKQRIARLRSSGLARSLPEAIDAAADLLKTSELERREIYVFTDRTRAAWPADRMKALEGKLGAVEGLSVYAIDVGADSVKNVSLSELRLSSQVIPREGTLVIHADLASLDVEGDKLVELFLRDKEGMLQKRSEAVVALRSGQPAGVEFPLVGLKEGTHQGKVRVASADALPADDERFFTVQVKPPWRVLVAAQSPAGYHASDFVRAVAPEEQARLGLARFNCEVVEFKALEGKPFEEYAAICLLDPDALPDVLWDDLKGFAESGRGVAIFLGDHALPEQLNRPAPQQLLAGAVGERPAVHDGLFLAPNYDHVLMARFRPIRNGVPWSDAPVYSYWPIPTLHEGAATVISYSNGAAALVDRPIGRGRILTMTTPVSSAPDASTADRWNELPTSFEPWPFVMLCGETLLYLAGNSEASMNFLTGQTAVTPLEGREQLPQNTYLLLTPTGDSIRQSLPAGDNAITVSSTETPGSYRLVAGAGETELDRGFSVNYPLEATQIDRLTEEEFKAVLGDFPWQVARTREEIEHRVSEGRVGQELFPYLIALVAFVLAFEHFLANRFYRERAAIATAKARAT